jgi:DNA-binding transcriptional ArsR family regulator
MPTNAALAETAALIGEPARAAMLAALLDGRALTAGELAEAAGITPQTASGHLGKLTEARLLAMARQGRHRYHRLASPAVARLIESLLDVAATSARRPVATGPRDAALRRARTCYDHLAGRLAVAIADAMAARGQIELTPDGGAVTAAGQDFLAGLGVAGLGAAGAPARGRLFCRPCLDWSERRPHVAGVLGAALCTRCFELGWIRRKAGGRALEITPPGWRGFAEAFGIAPGDLGA